ncbi:MAG: FKBP-type peptidyl-prolyl cis-trans isomerase N-terminal domain-containing protein, partial [Rikenellaceae bacterium]
MKKLLLATAVAVFGLSSCGDQMGKVTSLKTMADSVSYAYGSYIGSSVKGQMGTDNEDFDINVFASAIKSAVKGDSTLLAPDEIQTILQNYFQNVKPAKDKAKDQA